MDVTGNVCWACGAALPPPTHGPQSKEDERLAATVRQLTIQIIKLQEVREGVGRGVGLVEANNDRGTLCT